MKVTASAEQLSYLPQAKNLGLSAFAILFQLAGLVLTPFIWSRGGVFFAL